MINFIRASLHASPSLTYIMLKSRILQTLDPSVSLQLADVAIHASGLTILVLALDCASTPDACNQPQFAISRRYAPGVFIRRNEESKRKLWT